MGVGSDRIKGKGGEGPTGGVAKQQWSALLLVLRSALCTRMNVGRARLCPS